MRVVVENNKVLVWCRFEDKEMVKAIGNYKFIKARSAWSFPLKSLIKIVESLKIQHVSAEEKSHVERVYEKLKREQKELNQRIDMADQIKKGQGDLSLVPNIKECFTHQKQAIVIASMFSSYALFMETGTGKTLTAIKLIQFRRVPAMVVAPLSILESVWMHEIKKWGQKIDKKSGLTAVNLWKHPKEINKKYDVYVINYEQFKKIKDLEKIVKFLIIDESAKMKNNKSRITKAILDQKDKIPHKLILSGKPAPNDLLEYWAQMALINDELLEDNYYKFRNKYFFSTGYGGYMYRPLPGAKETIMKNIAKQAYFIKKEDAIDLPERVFHVRSVEMEELQRIKYEELKRDNIMEFKSRTTLGSNELAKIMKLRQITSGFTITTDGAIVDISKRKLQELLAVLDEIDESRQVIIWVHFHYEITMIKEALKKEKPLTLYGEMKQKEKEEAIDAFKAKKSRYIIAHPKSGGIGLNLQQCSYCIWYSISYSDEEFCQANDRIYRKGQKNTCTYVLLLAENSIDEVIYKALQSKERMSSACLAMLKGSK